MLKSTPTISKTESAVTVEKSVTPEGGSSIAAIWTGWAVIEPTRNSRRASCKGCGRQLEKGEGFRHSAALIRFPWYCCPACTDRNVEEAQLKNGLDIGYHLDDQGGLSVGGYVTVPKAMKLLNQSEKTQ